MKIRRSSRLVDMTRYLLQHPHQVITLSLFSDRYQSAKSSISEDLVIIKESFEGQGVGNLESIAGASGGVRYIPQVNKIHIKTFLQELSEHLSRADRLLPGGYLYMTDILGRPSFVNEIGRVIASIFSKRQVDVVMTMETKGIPLAYAAASQLNVPVVIVRKSSKVTEGSTVSINYVSGSSKRIQTMVLPRRSVNPGSRVLIIDDFMKAGGTVKGMTNLLNEFDAKAVGVAVLVETKPEVPKLVDDYLSLLQISEVNETGGLTIEEGNLFNSLGGFTHEDNTY